MPYSRYALAVQNSTWFFLYCQTFSPLVSSFLFQDQATLRHLYQKQAVMLSFTLITSFLACPANFSKERFITWRVNKQNFSGLKCGLWTIRKFSNKRNFKRFGFRAGLRINFKSVILFIVLNTGLTALAGKREVAFLAALLVRQARKFKFRVVY